jgi:hypothetical protein
MLWSAVQVTLELASSVFKTNNCFGPQGKEVHLKYGFVEETDFIYMICHCTDSINYKIIITKALGKCLLDFAASASFA